MRDALVARLAVVDCSGAPQEVLEIVVGAHILTIRTARQPWRIETTVAG